MSNSGIGGDDGGGGGESGDDGKLVFRRGR